MRLVRVTAADGAEWRVGIVWRPRWTALVGRFRTWRRNRRDGRRGDFTDGISGSLDSDWDGVLVGILAVLTVGVVAVLFWWLLLPLLAVDAVVVAILLALAIPARVLLRRPWTVEAAAGSGAAEESFATQVIGWVLGRKGRAQAKVLQIASQVRQGSSMGDVDAENRCNHLNDWNASFNDGRHREEHGMWLMSAVPAA